MDDEVNIMNMLGHGPLFGQPKRGDSAMPNDERLPSGSERNATHR
jgi:hypothetical protein